MSVPTDLYEVKRRIDRYLWEDESLPLVKLRQLMKGHFAEVGKVAIVGGLVRDFARRGAVSFKSDVDLVIEASPRDVQSLAHKLGGVPNRFGGFAYSHPLWKIDFWALETTWAAREGYVRVSSLHDIVNCTFFDCDSSIYDIEKRKVYAKPGYLDRIRRRVIDINLLPNPSINGNLLRAIRRTLLWNLQPGPLLRDFIETNISENSMREMALVESGLYSNTVIDKFENAKTLIREVNYRSGRSFLDPSHGRQLELPLDYRY